MKISYEGDPIICQKLVPQAEQLLTRTKNKGQAQATQPLAYPNTIAYVYVNTQEGIESIHIVAYQRSQGTQVRIPGFLSGMVTSGGNLTQPGNGVPELVFYASTKNSFVEWNFPRRTFASPQLAVQIYMGLEDTMLDGQVPGILNSQYTLGKPSQYTGLMCKVVQFIGGYGIPQAQPVFTQAVQQIIQTLKGQGVDVSNYLRPSMVFSKSNLGMGVQCHFDWRYSCTHGIYTETLLSGQKVYWIIEISQTNGIRAMPLQLEPLTTLPEFLTYLQGLAINTTAGTAKADWAQDALEVVTLFGGYPTNISFDTTDPIYKSQIQVLVAPTDATFLDYATNSEGLSPDIGWAFNDAGSKANVVGIHWTVDMAWAMAKHFAVTISIINGVGSATITRVGGGSMPGGLGTLKVPNGTLQECVSYNATQNRYGDFTMRPKATNTPIFVFWRGDVLETVFYSDGTVDNSETYKTKNEYGDKYNGSYLYYKTETWFGPTGMPGGMHSTSRDARIPLTTNYTSTEYTYHFGTWRNTYYNFDEFDNPANFYRDFYAWSETLSKSSSGQGTQNTTVFIPLYDRSAYYLTTMTYKNGNSETYTTNQSSIGDPYVYWWWNYWDSFDPSPAPPGTPLPVRWWGTLYTGVVTVMTDRYSGGFTNFNCTYMDQNYVSGFEPYGSTGPYAVTDAWRAQAAEWTKQTGQAEWANIGQNPVNQFNVTPGPAVPAPYSKSTGDTWTLEIYFCSPQFVGIINTIPGTPTFMYTNYEYWFSPSPDINNDYQSMEATRNCLGTAAIQTLWRDVNASTPWVIGPDGGKTGAFTPSFVGVVGDLT